MSEIVEAEWFAGKISDTSIHGIALETTALIRSGLLPVGARLPAVRDLAFALGVSPATISNAWRELRRQQVLSGRGRNGTWVIGDRLVAQPKRLASSGDYGADVIDLSRAVPDPALLPPLAEALAKSVETEGVNLYTRSRIVPELEAAVRASWPYEAEAFLATNGGYNAVYTLLHAILLPGACVAIEHPTAMRLLDILEDRGVEIVPVQCDSEGPVPQSLAAALKRHPSVFIFQPRLHSVTAATVSPERLAALGDVLEGHDTLILEDDGVADISAAPRQSLGNRFPERTVHIFSFSKTLGPDLRLAVMSGPASVINQTQSYRSFSAGWTSRLLQGAASWLLRQEETADIIANACAHYHDRSRALRQALAERGLHIDGENNGLCLWVPVESEQFAMVTLAARGIAVEPGEKFSVTPVNHIRVATGCLTDRYDTVADAIILAYKM